MKDQDQEAGFTLVEVLVSMTLLALLMWGTMDGFSLISRAEHQMVNRSIEMETADTTIQFLERHLSRVYPLRNGANIDFSGNEDLMNFIGPSLPQMAQPGLYRYQLTNVGIDDSMMILSIAWCLYAICTTMESFMQNAQSETVAMGFDVIRFNYVKPGARLCDREDPMQICTTDIVSDWRGQDALPALVIISFSIGGTDYTTIIEPMIDRWASCNFDPIAKECRNN